MIRVNPPAEVVSRGLIGARVQQPGTPTAPGSESRRMDRYAALGCRAASMALETAGRSRPNKGDPDWGIVLGSALGCWASNAEFLFDLDDRPTTELSPGLFVRTVANSVNGEIGIAHGLGGVNHTLVSGWSAGAEAVAEAAALLSEGRARWVVTGGVESPDDVLRRAHAAAREEDGLEWLPETIEEAAALCLLTARDSSSPTDRTRVTAYWRGRSPTGRWSLSTILGHSIGSVVVTNSIPPDLLRNWREQAGPRRLVYLPEEFGELGAAAAPFALADSRRFVGGPSGGDAILLVARGIEGNVAALEVEA